MTHTAALIKSLRFATLAAVLVAGTLSAGCATSQATSQTDKIRTAAAERVADRSDSRLNQHSR
jgi:hypothetical protein